MGREICPQALLSPGGLLLVLQNVIAPPGLGSWMPEKNCPSDAYPDSCSISAAVGTEVVGGCFDGDFAFDSRSHHDVGQDTRGAGGADRLPPSSCSGFESVVVVMDSWFHAVKLSPCSLGDTSRSSQKIGCRNVGPIP